MGSPNNIRDILTAFSPSQDYLAVSSGDGRVKIWDTVKGQIHSEISDFLPSEDSNILTKSGRGHLSVDYTCMRWFSWDKQKKRKLGCSLVVLGTGSGDVLALDVADGKRKWIANDCHPGGVTAISSTHSSVVYTAGADGMVCKIDCMSGDVKQRFKASTKAISSLSVSPDGKMLATASAKLKIFDCDDHNKMQKFSGHPGAVRCMNFTEDGRYIVSSSSGEKCIVVWDLGDGKKRSASCTLSMEHPAVQLDVRCNVQDGLDDPVLDIVATTETGVCYLWHGSIKEIQKSKPTKITVATEDLLRNHKSAVPLVFAAKLVGGAKSASRHVFVAFGLLIRPSFEKLLVNHGLDVTLKCSLDGILLPMSQSQKSKKRTNSQKAVSALDRANAEEAVLPVPKILDIHDKQTRRTQEVQDAEMSIAEAQATSSVLMEEQLRSLGILRTSDGMASGNNKFVKDIDLKVTLHDRALRATVSSMKPSEAYILLKDLLNMWQSKLCDGPQILKWIYSILVIHNQYIVSQESVTPILESIHKISKSRGSVIEPLLQLSGRLNLVTTQIDRAVHNKTQPKENDNEMDENEDEEEDEDVFETLYNEEDESDHSGSDDDMDDE